MRFVLNLPKNCPQEQSTLANLYPANSINAQINRGAELDEIIAVLTRETTLIFPCYSASLYLLFKMIGKE